MLPPIISVEFVACSLYFLTLFAAAFAPSLLKPIRFIKALSFGKRNNLGFGFPLCGNGVTVPISTKPKPNVSSSSRYFAFLSKPAARPTGFENVIQKTSFEKIPWGVSFFFKNFFVKENLHKNRSMFIEK